MHARIAELVRNAFRTQVEPFRGSLNLEQAMQIEELAPGSPAETLGLARGDLLLTLDGRPAAALDWSGATPESSRQPIYRFHRPGSQEIRVVRSSGVPLGLSLARTTAAIVACYRRPEPDFHDLHVLWKRGEWEALGQIARAHWSRRPAPWWRRKLSSLISLGPDLPEELEYLYWAALHHETGACDVGAKMIGNYLQRYVQNHTSNHAGVAYYYRAAELLRQGRTQDAAVAFAELWEWSELERAGQAATKLGVSLPEKDPGWVGRRFPIDYDLALKEARSESGRLSRTLAELGDGQVHLACLLGGYRSNGPYDSFMRRLRGYHAHVGAVLTSIHVIVESETPHRWGEGEEAALRAGLPITILWDGDGVCTRALDVRFSPAIVALDRHARILYSDSMGDDVELWKLLGRL